MLPIGGIKTNILSIVTMHLLYFIIWIIIILYFKIVLVAVLVVKSSLQCAIDTVNLLTYLLTYLQ